LDIAGDSFEIISADSVQVYRYMDIGSCKPDKKDLERITHHLIDIVDPDYQFTAGEFCNRAASVCEEIYRRRNYLLLPGGLDCISVHFLAEFLKYLKLTEASN
jgi:tRNA dimethylallyltransferase